MSKEADAAAAAAIARVKELQQDLVQVERQIYDLEGSYLEETRDTGNIFTGWDEYLGLAKGSSKGGKRGGIDNEERLFSLSSVSSPIGRAAAENQQAAPTTPAPTKLAKQSSHRRASDAAASGKKRRR